MKINGVMQPLVTVVVERHVEDSETQHDLDVCGIRAVREDGSLGSWVNYDDETGEIGNGYTSSHAFHAFIATRTECDAYVAGYERAVTDIVRTIGRAGGEDK